MFRLVPDNIGRQRANEHEHARANTHASTSARLSCADSRPGSLPERPAFAPGCPQTRGTVRARDKHAPDRMRTRTSPTRARTSTSTHARTRTHARARRRQTTTATGCPAFAPGCPQTHGTACRRLQHARTSTSTTARLSCAAGVDANTHARERARDFEPLARTCSRRPDRTRPA
jgi:hypothetical protein